MHTVRLLSSLAGLAMQTAVYNMQLQPCRFNPAAAAPTHTRTHGRSLCPCRPKTKRGTSSVDNLRVDRTNSSSPIHFFRCFHLSVFSFGFFFTPPCLTIFTIISNRVKAFSVGDSKAQCMLREFGEWSSSFQQKKGGVKRERERGCCCW